MMIKHEDMYRALLEKDESYKGQYYTAVKTTGIYCQMPCPCKIPKSENIIFRDTLLSCISHGYRECKVCKPLSSQFNDDIVKQYVVWLERQELPPKSYKQHPIHSVQMLERIKLHFLRICGFSLGEYIRIKRVNRIIRQDKKDEQHLQPIVTNYMDTPLGVMVYCFTHKGLCLLEFVNRRMLETELADVKRAVRGYFTIRVTEQTRVLEVQLQEYFEQKRSQFDIPLDFIGTVFQKKVWRLLLDIPYGKQATYKEQSLKYGDVDAIRAVAGANGKNKIGIIVPCHRVVGSNGKMVGYGGGVDRKKKLLALESKTEVLF